MLQPQQSDTLASGVVGEMIEHQLGKTQTPKLWTDVHPFEFAVVRPKQLNTPAADGRAVVTDEKEGHPLRDQLLYTVAMTTFPRIERRQVCLELVNQRSGVGGVGSFCSYGDFHVSWRSLLMRAPNRQTSCAAPLGNLSVYLRLAIQVPQGFSS